MTLHRLSVALAYALALTSFGWVRPARDGALLLWGAHFARRVLETLAYEVRPSARRTSMAGGEMVGVVLYYFAAGVLVARSLSSGALVAAGARWAAGAALWLAAESLNAAHHFVLYRRAGEGGPARGLLFGTVGKPHYTCEIASWVAYAVMFPTVGTVGFAVASTAAMVSRSKAHGAPCKLVPGVF